MRSLGPILATGAVSFFVTSVINDSGVEEKARIVVATGVAAIGLGLIEQATPRVAVALAWSALITSLFIPSGPRGISPIQVFEHWYNER